METKPYNTYMTITREELASVVNGWDKRTATELFSRYPRISAIDFCTHSNNGSQSRYVPERGTIVYVKSTAGRYGKSKIVRVGA